MVRKVATWRVNKIFLQNARTIKSFFADINFKKTINARGKNRRFSVYLKLLESKTFEFVINWWENIRKFKKVVTLV